MRFLLIFSLVFYLGFSALYAQTDTAFWEMKMTEILKASTRNYSELFQTSANCGFDSVSVVRFQHQFSQNENQLYLFELNCTNYSVLLSVNQNDTSRIGFGPLHEFSLRFPANSYRKKDCLAVLNMLREYIRPGLPLSKPIKFGVHSFSIADSSYREYVFSRHNKWIYVRNVRLFRFNDNGKFKRLRGNNRTSHLPFVTNDGSVFGRYPQFLDAE